MRNEAKKPAKTAATKPASLTQVLRDAISDFEPGFNELSRQTGVEQSVISRFANGSDIRMATADRLAAALGVTASYKPAPKAGASEEGTRNVVVTYDVVLGKKRPSKPARRKAN